MDTRRFWILIDKANKEASREEIEREESLERILRSLTPSEIRAFNDIGNEFFHKAYDWNLWGAAYIIMGGCGDDSFADFRQALIGLGKNRYEKAMKNPESLATLTEDEVDFVHTQSYLHVVDDLIETDPNGGRTAIPHPKQPTGTEWEEDELENRFPKLSKRFSDNTNAANDLTVTSDARIGWSFRSLDWGHKICRHLTKEINDALDPANTDPERLDAVFPAIDLLLYIQKSAHVYPWGRQRVGTWRHRVFEILKKPNELAPYYQFLPTDASKRINKLFDELESNVCEEHL